MSTVYEQEQQRMEKPARGSSGGGDFTWLEIDKPANINAKTYRNIRVVQRLAWINGAPDPAQPQAEFWKRVSVHRARIDGKWWMGVCPEDRDQDGWRDRATCPICLLQKELWNTKREDYDKVAKEIGARWRVYCNVIDLDDINGHWHEDGNGGWTVRPKIHGYSKTIHNSMMSACVHNGPIEDHATGRPLVLECERTGPEKQNIRYGITTKDREALPQELMPIVWGAYDLEGLAKPSTMEDLRKVAQAIDPRGATGAAPSGYHAPPATSPAPSYPTAAPAGPPTSAAPPPPAGPPTGAPPPAAAPPSAGPPVAAAPPSYQSQGGYPVAGPPAAAPPPQAAPPPPAGPPATAAPPPPTQAPAPAPPPAAVPYHYSGPSGQHQDMTPAKVAEMCRAAPTAQHNVWREGMAEWELAANQPDVQALIQQQDAPPAGNARPPGPPAPPGPPGGTAF